MFIFKMVFSNFTKITSGNTILFKTDVGIENVDKIRFYKDDSSGSFDKKEFRWSFNNNYWSSWEKLNQGNITSINLKGNKYFFLELRYVLSAQGSGNISFFRLYYDIVGETSQTPIVQNPTFSTKETTSINAATLCGKDCEYYLWRPNHKGLQSIGTIDGLQQILNNLSARIQNLPFDFLNVDGSGSGVFYEKVNNSIYFKRIAPGDNAYIAETPDGVITIGLEPSIVNNVDASLNQLYNLYDNTITDASSFGGGAEILRDKSNQQLNFRTLVSGNANVLITTVGDQIRISLDSSVVADPTWSDSDPVSADVGGINSGDTLDGSTSIDILEKMLYEYKQPILNLNIDPSQGYYEKWVWPPEEVSIYGNFDNSSFVKNKIYDASLYRNGTGILNHIGYLDVNSGTFQWRDTSGLSYWDDTIYTVKIYHKYNNINIQPVESSAYIKFINAYY
ncbi:MAG: hypothetical protein ACOC1K_03270, partial [Nanoarchaeota archaeon]